MSVNKLKVQAFRANDLSEDTGKQFEIGKSWSEFFEIDDAVGDISFVLEFKPINKVYESLNGRKIELKLSGLTNRNDRKAYANGTRSGHSAIKEFFLRDLHLTVGNNSNDFFAIYKASALEYYLYFIPRLLYDNFIKIFESVNPAITISKIKEKECGLDDSLQQIFYGAPGTGKSHKIDEIVNENKYASVRTTFHPDSDYSTFVGAYKPSMEDVDISVVPVVLVNGITHSGEKTIREKRIVYKFTPQAFTKAYLSAWKKMVEGGDSPQPQFLIIEEINRGNCAQIFGDIFQLLDRNDNRFSTYPIEADSDLQKYIADAFANSEDYKLLDNINAEGAVEGYVSNYGATLSADIQNGRILLLPPNLYIWATMNTSDQSLFPIDSAFKRRWEWKYIPIEDAGKGWKINVNNNEYDWYPFLEAVNKEVFDLTRSEDKQLGYFFVKAKSGVVDAETLVNKVYFYLWMDVFKDYDYENQKAFRKLGSNEPITFRDFFNGQDVDEVMAEQVLINLGLAKTQEVTE